MLLLTKSVNIFKRKKTKDSKYTNNLELTCSICLCLINKDDVDSVTTLCNHFYHRDCICEWINSSYVPTCPLCRSNLVTKDGFLYVY